MYIAYLDEFGHIGPYVARTDSRFNTHPVFGLAGIVLPDDRVREFATWFFKLKVNLLRPEIELSGEHAARWEKKGSALLTTQNFEKYRELRFAINRILNKIESVGGFVFYIGAAKYKTPDESSSEQLYAAILRRAIQRLNKQAQADNTDFMLVLDESDTKFHRDVIVKKATLTMFGADYCDRLIEPPFQVCSHLYQTLQCADWICGLVGRISAYEAEQTDFADFSWAQKFFGDRLKHASKRSSVRSKDSALRLRSLWDEKGSELTAAASITTVKETVAIVPAPDFLCAD